MNIVLLISLGLGLAQSNTVNFIRNAGKGLKDAQARAGNTAYIIETMVPVNSTQLQVRITVPRNKESKVFGLNVLLHGDLGDSFYEMPNAGIQHNLLGVAILAPNILMQWGGSDEARTESEYHSMLIYELVTTKLPKYIEFDATNIYYTGISGGAFLLSGSYLGLFGRTCAGFLLLCGAMLPQNTDLPNMQANLPARIHFQSTENELEWIKQMIDETVEFVGKVAASTGASATVLNQRLTIDKTPKGNHCSFDSVGFSSGIQLALDNFHNLMVLNFGSFTKNPLTSILFIQ